MSSQKKGNNIQVTYLHPRTPPSSPKLEPASQPPNIPEDHISEVEYIKLIEDERAKYAEARKTIAKLVNKLQNDQEIIQQERLETSEKIAALQSIYQSKIESLLEQLQAHKHLREAEQKEKLQTLEELANEMDLLEKENEVTRQQLEQERAANGQLLVAMQDEVANVQKQMEVMRSEVDASESTKRENDLNTHKLTAIEESIKQVMDFCVKEMETQVRRSLEDASFYSTREKLQAQIDEERKSRNFILMMDEAELKSILEKERGVLQEENERLEQEEKKKTDMGLRVRHMLDAHSSAKRELEAVKQKRETAEALLEQLKNEAKNLEEMTNMLSSMPPSDSFDSDSSKDDSTDSIGSEKWNTPPVELSQESSQSASPVPPTESGPTPSDLLNAELARQMNRSISSYLSSSSSNSSFSSYSSSLSSIGSSSARSASPPPSPSSKSLPPEVPARLSPRTLSARSASASPRHPSPSHEPSVAPPSPRAASSPRSLTSAVKSIFQKDKDKEKEKEKDKDSEKAPSVPLLDLRPENVPMARSPSSTISPSSTPVAMINESPRSANHALLLAAKRGASWAAAPTPPPVFGSSTNLPIPLKPRAKSNLAVSASHPDVPALKIKYEGLAPASEESPPVHPRTVPPVSLMSKLGSLSKTSCPDMNGNGSSRSPHSDRDNGLSKASWPDASGNVSPRSPRSPHKEGENGTAEESPGAIRRRAFSMTTPRKDPVPTQGTYATSQADTPALDRQRSVSLDITIPDYQPPTKNDKRERQKSPTGLFFGRPLFPFSTHSHAAQAQAPAAQPSTLEKSQSVAQVEQHAVKDQAAPQDIVGNRVSLRPSFSAPLKLDKPPKEKKPRSLRNTFSLGSKVTTDDKDYVEILSAVEDHKWNCKLDNDTTAESICEKLAQKLDPNFANYELYLFVGKTKRILHGNERLMEVRSKLGKEWAKCTLKLSYHVPGSTSSLVALVSPHLLSSSEQSPLSSPDSSSSSSSPSVSSPSVTSPPATPDPPSPPRRQRTVSSPNTASKNDNEKRSLRRQSTHSDVPSPTTRRDSLRSPLQYFFSKGESNKKPAVQDVFSPEILSPPSLIPPTSSSLEPPSKSSFLLSPPQIPRPQEADSSTHSPSFPRTQSSPINARTDAPFPLRKRSMSNADQQMQVIAQAVVAHEKRATAPPHAIEYCVKIESLVHPDKDGWKIRLDKPTTVQQVCKKMGTILGKNCSALELYEVQGLNKRLLPGDQIVQDIVATWRANQKNNSFGLLYVEITDNFATIDTKKFGEFITVQSMLEGNTWRVKLGSSDTVEEVCNRLSKKIDEKYKYLELYIIGTKEPLPKERNMFEIMLRLEPHKRQFGLVYKRTAYDNDARYSLSSSQLRPGEVIEDSPRMPSIFSPGKELLEGLHHSGEFIDSDIFKTVPAVLGIPGIIVEVFKYIWVTCDNSIYIYDREKMLPVTVVKTPGLIMTVRLCGKKVWVGFLDGSLRIYNRKGRQDHELSLEFQSEVTAIQFTGRVVWSAADMNLCIWDKNNKIVKKLNTGNYIYCMLVVGTLMWVGTESSIKRWDIVNVKHVDTLKFPDTPRLVSSMVLIDREVWSTSSDSRVAVWHAETGQVVKMITTQGDVFSLSFGGTSVWMGTTDGIVVYDKMTKDLVRHISSPQAMKTRCLCETKVGDKWFVWSGNVQGEVLIWRTDAEKSSANKITNKKKQIVTSSWQQLITILADINLLGMSGEAQEVFDAITVLDRQISNL